MTNNDPLMGVTECESYPPRLKQILQEIITRTKTIKTLEETNSTFEGVNGKHSFGE